MFTLCECFEGKHKAATQWVDYKLGPSFKQTEVINIEFPLHSTGGFQPASILLRIKHRRGSFPRTLKPFCTSVCACIVFAPTCVSFVSLLSHIQVVIQFDPWISPWITKWWETGQIWSLELGAGRNVFRKRGTFLFLRKTKKEMFLKRWHWF